jgi:hypothetical protein
MQPESLHDYLDISQRFPIHFRCFSEGLQYSLEDL